MADTEQPWEERRVEDAMWGDRIVRGRLTGPATMDFQITRAANLELEIEVEDEFQGTLKWDGCIDYYKTNNMHGSHICVLDDYIENLRESFEMVYEIGRALMGDDNVEF